ncbi:hypothetical protein ACI2KT_19320 [Ensifer adhaerens]|uniref:hypothetical protein n=1 Tax=Ensifer adhaerens TaxID=106592 RepID=UPI00384EA742
MAGKIGQVFAIRQRHRGVPSPLAPLKEKKCRSRFAGRAVPNGGQPMIKRLAIDDFHGKGAAR